MAETTQQDAKLTTITGEETPTTVDDGFITPVFLDWAVLLKQVVFGVVPEGEDWLHLWIPIVLVGSPIRGDEEPSELLTDDSVSEQG